MTETTASTDWERARRNLAHEDEVPVAGHLARATAFAADLALMAMIVTAIDVVLGLALTLGAAADLLPSVSGPWKHPAPEVYQYPIVVAIQNVAVVLALAYMPWFWIRGGQTPGMAFTGLRVERSDLGDLDIPTAILRMVALPFAIVSVIGIWWVFVDSKRRGWHDIVAGTIVIAE